jgi:hypothetical protein
MIRKLQIPDDPAIINAQDVADVMQANAQGGRESLTRLILRGSVNEYHPDQDKNLLANPITASTVSRSSIPYVELSDGSHTYRVWRTGKVEGQGQAPPVHDYPPIAQYLLSNRWPFSDGSTVAISASGSTSISAQDVTYYTTSGATDFDVNADYIRSDETLRCLVAVEGDGTANIISATLEERPSGSSNRTVASSSVSSSHTGWKIFEVSLSPSSRVPYNHDPLVLTVDCGSLNYTRPVLRPQRPSLAPSHFPLPDGTALLHLSGGSGWTTEAGRISCQSTQFVTDLAAGRVFAVAFRWPEASVKRAVVTGEDRSQTHEIDHTLVPRLWTTEQLPGHEHLPLARMSAQ